MKEVFLYTCCLLLLVVRLSQTKGPPRISADSQFTRHVARVGDNVKLHCLVEASLSQAPIFSWHKDDETIHNGWPRFKSNDHDPVLRIKDLEVTDSGVYVCKATNGFGSADAKHLLYVYVKPKFLHPTSMEPYIPTSAGSTVYIPCEATGRPKPEIVWYREHKQLSDNELAALAGGSHSEPGILKIHSVKERHAGRYTCKPLNSAGSINFTFTLAVVGSNKVETKPQFVDGHPENVTAYYGQPASFRCVVRSNAVPLLQWLKPVPASSETKFLSSSATNNTVVLNNQRYLILQGSSVSSPNEGVYSNTLTIPSVHQYDYGMYICSVASNQGLLHKSVFLLPQPGDSNAVRSEKSSQEWMSSGYYFVFGIIVSLSVTVVVVVAATVVCCRRSKTKEKVTTSSSPLANQLVSSTSSGRPASRSQTVHSNQGGSNLMVAGTHFQPMYKEASMHGTWQYANYYTQKQPPMSDVSMGHSPTRDITSGIYPQHSYPLQEVQMDHQGAQMAHHYSLITGSTASHQNPPSLASSSQKQFYYRPPYRQQQAPLLSGGSPAPPG